MSSIVTTWPVSASFGPVRGFIGGFLAMFVRKNYTGTGGASNGFLR